MVSQLALKSRIASTASLAKIFNAQEMIASSHIAKARDVALNAKPYSDAIFDAVQALAAHAHIDHPIVGKKDVDNPRVAVLAVTADRGMAGPYTSSIIRETEQLLAMLDDEGKQPQLYVYGRRGVNYYKYRNRPIAGTWEGQSDHPSVAIAQSIAGELISAYSKKAAQGGVSELYIVFTEFVNMVVQQVRVLRMLPVELIRHDAPHEGSPADSAEGGVAPQGVREANQTTSAEGNEQAGSSQAEQAKSGQTNSHARSLRERASIIKDRLIRATAEIESGTVPVYHYEPSAEALMDAILPKYIQSRIHECLLTAAASETASRQNAMHTATENANNLIDELTRQLNRTRQASITQELTEIIGSANALNMKE